MKQEIFNDYDVEYTEFTRTLHELIKMNYIIDDQSFSYYLDSKKKGNYTIVAHHKSSK